MADSVGTYQQQNPRNRHHAACAGDPTHKTTGLTSLKAPQYRRTSAGAERNTWSTVLVCPPMTGASPKGSRVLSMRPRCMGKKWKPLISMKVKGTSSSTAHSCTRPNLGWPACRLQWCNRRRASSWASSWRGVSHARHPLLKVMHLQQEGPASAQYNHMMSSTPVSGGRTPRC